MANDTAAHGFSKLLTYEATQIVGKIFGVVKLTGPDFAVSPNLSEVCNVIRPR